jgi:hypothetical protein
MSMKKITLCFGLLCGPLLLGCVVDGAPEMTSMVADTDAESSGTAAPTTSETTAAPTTSETTSETPDASTGDVEILNCDPWEQDCPAGLKCMGYTDDGDFFTGTKCTPVVENAGVAGDECYADGGWSTGVDDCALGHVCWNINPETSIGACEPLCTGSPEAAGCPDQGDVCVFWVPGLVHVCLQGCEPLIQDCPVAQLCLPSGEQFVCKLDYSFEEGQEYDPCQFSNGCDPGLLCASSVEAVECDQDSPYCCLSMCDLDDPVCTGMGSVCESIYGDEEPPPAFANVGACGLPG